MRYLSAQYVPFFKNELWRSLAQQANQKAQEIDTKNLGYALKIKGSLSVFQEASVAIEGRRIIARRTSGGALRSSI